MTAKIVHLIGQMGRGGAERQLLHLAGSLHARRWPQAVVSFNASDAWRDEWARMGIPFYEVPRCAFKPWRLLQLSRILLRERPAILHTWSAFVAAYANWALGKGNARVVFGVRTDLTVNTHTGEPVDRVPFVRSLARADCAVSNSQSALDSLSGRGITLRRSTVIRNIVISRNRAKAAESASKPRIVAVGRLDILKGHDCLLRAAAILAAEHKTFELLVVGAGPQRKALESLAAELNLGHCVRLLNETDGVSQLLATAHILAHPSKREGLSNTIIEAMAEGLPVVSTLECASEIIEDGRTGLLVPAGRPTALADALRRLLDEPALRGRLGEAAFRHVEECCNAEVITGQYENVYRSLLTP